jgi:hypothetical protein
MTKLVKLAGVALVATLAACASRAHMWDASGRSYWAAFAQQTPQLKAPLKGPVSGLDSQEAAIIAQTYRRGLAPKAAQPREPPVLIVGQPSAETGGYSMPPPSVPAK